MSVEDLPNPFKFDSDGCPQWTGELPDGALRDVANAMLRVCSHVASKGLGEKQPAKGFLMIAGSSEKLLCKGCIGNLGRYNKYGSIYVSIFDVVSDAEVQRFVFPDFITDGAMIIDFHCGKILGHGYTVTQNLERASKKGGKKHEAASAASQTGPCFVVKCSEDVCCVDGTGSGKFAVFNGCKEAMHVPVKSNLITGLTPELAARVHRIEEHLGISIELSSQPSDCSPIPGSCSTRIQSMEDHMGQALTIDSASKGSSRQSSGAACQNMFSNQHERFPIVIVLAGSCIDDEMMNARAVSRLRESNLLHYEHAEDLADLGDIVRRTHPCIVHIESVNGVIQWLDPLSDSDEKLLLPELVASRVWHEIKPQSEDDCRRQWRGCIINAGSTSKKDASDLFEDEATALSLMAWEKSPSKHQRQYVRKSFYSFFSPSIPVEQYESTMQKAFPAVAEGKSLFIVPDSSSVSKDTREVGSRKRYHSISINIKKYGISCAWCHNLACEVAKIRLEERFGCKLNWEIEAALVCEQDITMPETVTLDQLQSMEREIQNMLPRGLVVSVSGRGSIHVRMSLEALQVLNKAVSYPKPSHQLSTPVEWGLGEVDLRFVQPVELEVWVQNVASPSICNIFSDLLTAVEHFNILGVWHYHIEDRTSCWNITMSAGKLCIDNGHTSSELTKHDECFLATFNGSDGRPSQIVKLLPLHDNISFCLSIDDQGEQWHPEIIATKHQVSVTFLDGSTTVFGGCCAGQCIKDVREALEALKVLSANCSKCDSGSHIMSLSWEAPLACKKAAQWQQSLSLLDKMHKDCLSLFFISFRQAVSVCKPSAQWQRALSLLTAMHTEGVSPSMISFNEAILACEKAAQWEQSLLLVDEMHEEGLLPGINEAISRGALWQQALSMLNEMQSISLASNVYLCNSCLLPLENGHWCCRKCNEYYCFNCRPHNLHYLLSHGVRALFDSDTLTEEMIMEGLQAGVICSPLAPLAVDALASDYLDSKEEEYVNESETSTLSAHLLAVAHGKPHGESPLGYLPGYGCLGCEKTGIILCCPPIQVGLPSNDDIVLYHYTNQLAYQRIMGDIHKHLRPSCGSRAHFGDGVYCTLHPPDKFGSKDGILVNNWTNSSDPVVQEQRISGWRSIGAVDYCVPIVVSRGFAVNVQKQMTIQMAEPGFVPLHNDPIRKDRDLWVVLIPDADGRAQICAEHVASVYHQLASPDFSVRLGAVETLAGDVHAGSSFAAEAVLGLLCDNDHNVRIAVTWAIAGAAQMGALKREEMFAAIQELASNENDERVKEHVLDALSFLDVQGSSRDLSILRLRLKRAEHGILEIYLLDGEKVTLQEIRLGMRLWWVLECLERALPLKPGGHYELLYENELLLQSNLVKLEMLDGIQAVVSPLHSAGFDEDGAPMWNTAWNGGRPLPPECLEPVVNSTLKLASRVATEGLGEKTPAKGFLIIVGDEEKLLDGSLGSCGKLNKFFDVEISVLNLDDEGFVFILPDFGMDKAIIICGKTGRVVASKFAVADISTGDSSKGLKHQAGSAAGQKGFFAIKCSEDSCSVDGQSVGVFTIFPGTRDYIEVPVKQRVQAKGIRTKQQQ